MTHERPHVTLHFAQSLDGRIGSRQGRLLLSGDDGMLALHEARASHDAILVGIRTVIADDPALTVRRCKGENPRPVVLSSTFAFPVGAKLLSNRDLLVFGTQDSSSRRAALEERGVQAVLTSSSPTGEVDIRSMLTDLYARGVRRLLVEGGGSVITSFIDAGAVDDLTVELVPLLLGGEGIGALARPLAISAPLRKVHYQPLKGGHVLMKASMTSARHAVASTQSASLPS